MMTQQITSDVQCLHILPVTIFKGPPVHTTLSTESLALYLKTVLTRSKFKHVNLKHLFDYAILNTDYYQFFLIINM